MNMTKHFGLFITIIGLLAVVITGVMCVYNLIGWYVILFFVGLLLMTIGKWIIEEGD